MRGRRRSIGGIVLVLAAACLLATESSAQRYTFKQYVDGLGNLNVKSLYQDRKGFLWVGTQGGLFRYDGYQFEEYGPKNGLTSPMIEDILEDRGGRLWVATPSGFFVRDGDRFDSVLLNGNPVSIRVGSRIVSSGMSVLVSVDHGGLYEAERAGNGWQLRALLRLKMMDPDASATRGVATGPDGALWFGCATHICRYRDGALTKWEERNGLAAESWDYLLFDRDGKLWARGKAHIAVLAPKAPNFEARDITNAPKSLDYRTLALDPQGRVLAPCNNALARFEAGKWTFITEANGLEGETVTVALTDREGSVWIGVLGRGLARWLGYESWEHWTKANGLQSNLVWAVTRDVNGRLWIGDDKGISIMDRGSKELRRWTAPGISTGGYSSIAASKDGYVWIGFRNRYIFRIDTKTWRTERYPVGDISKLFVDSHDRVWSAALDALQVSEPGRDGKPRTGFHKVEADALAPGGFEDIAEGPDGRLWVASDDGLLTNGPEGWTRIELDWRQLGNKSLLDVMADPDGNVWFDGYFSGIVRLKLKGSKVAEMVRFERPAVVSERYDFLARDGRGWIWFGGDRGVDAFDGKNWHRYTQDDGLIWNDTAAKAFLSDGDDSVWIGTGGGLSHFTANKTIATAPAPTFLSARLGARALAQGASVPWSGDPLSIGLASLTFRNEKAIRFRYRLQGIDPDWTETAQREVRYAQLPPGSYQFQAMALAGPETTISPRSTFSFVILPPWWRTRTFDFLAYGSAVCLILMAWRWSHRLMIARQNKLEVLVRERTRELESEKTELIEAKADLAEQASRDSLTGLLNRGAILRVLEQEMRRSQRERNPFAAVLIDLDHFKDVNDSYGHLIGDEVLREFARRLRESLRPYDHIGRYGGEEFLIVLPGLKDESIGRIEQIHRQMSQEPLLCGEELLQITCSFGVAWFRSEMITTEALLDIADQALYTAKANGRNRVEAAGLPGASGAVAGN